MTTIIFLLCTLGFFVIFCFLSIFLVLALVGSEHEPRKWRNFWIPTLLVCAFLGMLMAHYWEFGLFQPSGRGEHIGYITSAETTGLFVKTKRVYFKTSQRSSQEYSYCVMSSQVFTKIKKILSNNPNEHLKITYKSYWINGLVNCDMEGAIITHVEKSKK